MEDNFDLIIGIVFLFIVLILFFLGYIEQPPEEEYEKYVNFKEGIDKDLIKKYRIGDYNKNDLFEYCLNESGNVSELYIENKVKYCNFKVNNIEVGDN